MVVWDSFNLVYPPEPPHSSGAFRETSSGHLHHESTRKFIAYLNTTLNGIYGMLKFQSKFNLYVKYFFVIFVSAVAGYVKVR